MSKKDQEKIEAIVNTEFEWSVMTDLYNNGLTKEHLDCKNYISKFFVPSTIIGTHVLFENQKPTIIQDQTMKTVYLKRYCKLVHNAIYTKKSNI